MFNLLRYKKLYCSQVDEDDCGIAALNMVFKNFGSEYSLSKLRFLAKTSQQGTTIFGLIKAAEELNLEANALQADMGIFEDENLTLPIIAHVLKQGKVLHYYVVFDVSKDFLIIGDPDPTIGITKISKKDFENEWTGNFITFSKGKNFVSEKQRNNSLLKFIPVLRQQKSLIFWIAFAAILLMIISIAGSLFLERLVDTYIPQKNMNTLGIISVCLIGAYLLQSVMTYFQNFLLTIFGQNLSRKIILNYIKHLFELPMSFFSTRRVGEIVSRFTDASKIIDALASTILTLFLDVWMLVTISIVLAFLNTRLFVISLVSIPVYSVIIYAFKDTFNDLNHESMEKAALLNSAIIENVTGIETVKSLTSEEFSYNQITDKFENFLNSSLRYTKADQGQQALKIGLKLILIVFILWAGAIQVMKGNLTVGRLLAFNALVTYFLNPLENVINLQPKLQTARVANVRLNEILLVDPEFNGGVLASLTNLNGDIVFEDVEFSYGYGSNVLHNINIKVQKNSSTTIVGMSGSGKSTLVKLMVGFYQAGSGQILLNGKLIDSIDRHAVRQAITYVPQEPVMFAGTVLENLIMQNKRNISIDKVKKACRIAEIDKDIENFPMGYDTDISEHGSSISVGQKQRLSIARSLLTESNVLIFDESTSSLDTITEQRIIENLLNLNDKTLIFVAHRLSIAKQTENIIVMDHGNVVETGSHDKLILENGYYKELCTVKTKKKVY